MAQLEILLTKRQKELLVLVALGLNNLDIAERLDISPLTVGSLLKNLRNKVGVDSRVELGTFTCLGFPPSEGYLRDRWFSN